MPDSQLIVRGISKIESPGAGPDVKHLLSLTAPLNVTFDDGQTAQLAPGDRFALHKEILTELQRVGLSVYAEVDAASRTITNLLIPLQGIVVALTRDSSGDVTFELDNSARPLAFQKVNPDYPDWLNVLQEAQLDGVPVLVTESEPGAEIVDIRRAEIPPEPALHLAAAVAPAPLPAAGGPVTPERAAEMFELAASSSCDALAPTASCIPFLYPDDGCHARAHEMCRLIIEAGEQPAKVWNYSRNGTHPLVVQTPNSPACKVKWSLHVAVTLQVQAPGEPDSQTLVLDPSLFPMGPVSVAAWQAAQGDPNSCLLFTSPDPFLPPVPGGVKTDPRYTKTDQELARYRLALKHQAARIGPPPYACP